jgi:hypothetical protein
MVGTDVIRERAFDMEPRAALVAEQMLRRADQSFAGQPIAQVGPACGQGAEPLRQSQSTVKLTAVDVKDPQTPQRSQLVLGIVKARRNLENACPGRADLGCISASG